MIGYCGTRSTDQNAEPVYKSKVNLGSNGRTRENRAYLHVNITCLSIYSVSFNAEEEECTISNNVTHGGFASIKQKR